MSFNLPVGLELELERFARAEQISADEALARLVRRGLEANEPSEKHEDGVSRREKADVAMSTVRDQLRQVETLGELTPTDSADVRREKLEALFALSDAAISEGMETWTTDRILDEVAERRGTYKTNLY